MRADEVKIHPLAQRRLSPAGLRRVTDELDLDSIGVIHAVDYEIDGETGPWVVDGQHRVVALCRLGMGEWKIELKIHENVTNHAGAHKLFVTLNNRSVVAAYDRFKNEVGFGDEIACLAKSVAEKHGLTPTRGAADGGIACVTILKRVVAFDEGQTADQTLSVLTRAHGKTSAAVEGKLVEGVAQILGFYNGQVDIDVLTRKLAKYPGGAAGLLGDAKGLARLRRSSLGRAVAEVVVETYNRGRRQKLPSLP